MKYDCMTPEEFALWANQTRRNAKGSPCYDCPVWFRLEESRAGRCIKAPAPRPVVRVILTEREIARRAYKRDWMRRKREVAA